MKGNAMLNYSWSPAIGEDVPNIVKLAEDNFQNEIDEFFKPEPKAYARNLTLSVVNQYYNPFSDLLSVCKDDTGKIIAYTWANNYQRASWSDDNMIVIKIAHVDLKLPTKTRIKLIHDMMFLWERFASLSGTPIICSTTMRKEQDAFLKLHEKKGYSIRGSYAYKRVSTTQATPAN